MTARVSQLKCAREFLHFAGGMLYANEKVNNLILGVAERLVRDPEAYQKPFFTVVMAEDDGVILAALMTPPHNLILGGDDQYQEGVSALVDYLLDHPVDIPGVIAPAHIAKCFAYEWEKLMKEDSKLSMRQKVYELRAVHMPPMPPGDFRIAGVGDVSQVAAWLHAFEIEAMGKHGDLDLERAKTLIDKGNIVVWECDGEIASMAMKTRPVTHSISISGVFTPPEQRRQGYAAALVAKLSQHLLESGYQSVTLYTDLANPTSNSIYRRIGYQPVCDYRMYSFSG